MARRRRYCVEIRASRRHARNGVDVSYRITSPDLWRRGAWPNDADVASNPALFDRAVAEAAAAAS